MSWSVNFIGNPAKIVDALTKHSSTLSGKSKEEFDAALPHICGLVSQNYNPKYEPVLTLAASGSGYNEQNSCMVNITNVGGMLV